MKDHNSFLDEFAHALHESRHARTPPPLRRRGAKALIRRVLGIFFPHFEFTPLTSEKDLRKELQLLTEELTATLTPFAKRLSAPPQEIAAQYIQQLPKIRARMELDAESIFKGDPAAESLDEVLIAYPGFFAIAVYRLAHELHTMKIPIVPRMLTEYAHEKTGIDIHPGASIGESFFIDHGTGIVIGETTVIHDNVKLYQGVTLGALSVEKTMANMKRHPTIEKNVVIYSNATILGGETCIGHDSIIGGNVWITSSVAPHSTVYRGGEARAKTS